MSEKSSRSDQSDEPLCVICSVAAVGVGPFSRTHLCQEHLGYDIAAVHSLKNEVAEELRELLENGVGKAAPGTHTISKELQVSDGLKTIEARCLSMQQHLDGFYARVKMQIDQYLRAARLCQAGIDDANCYSDEMKAAESAGDIGEIVRLAMSMQLSIPDLRADLEVAQSLRLENDGAQWQLLRLSQLEQLVDSAAAGVSTTDAAVSAMPDARDAFVTAGPQVESIGLTVSPLLTDAAIGTMPNVSDASNTASDSVLDPITFSHQVQLDCRVDWLTVCSDTRGFLADHSRCVVPADSSDSNSLDLPEPCIYARVTGAAYLLVLSVDGTHRLQCRSDLDINRGVCGLHCHRQLLYIAQEEAVKITDLSGRQLREIRPQFDGFNDIRGIGGNSLSLLITSGNRIAVFSKATDQLEMVITIDQIPDADLGSVAIHQHCILVTDLEHKQVHRVSIDSRQLIVHQPTEQFGLSQFAWPKGLAIDRRTRLFVSDVNSHSVQVLSADDGSLLRTLGTPGQSGNTDASFNRPWGLAATTGSAIEQLIVADYINMRLMIWNID